MAYITLPTLEQLDPAVRQQLEGARAKTGDPGEIAYLVAVRPDIFQMTMGMVRTLLLSPTQLPYRIKETIALLVSAQNRCDMCVGEHVRIARLLGMSEAQVEQALGGLDGMQLPDDERTLLAFCLKAGGQGELSRHAVGRGRRQGGRIQRAADPRGRRCRRLLQLHQHDLERPRRRKVRESLTDGAERGGGTQRPGRLMLPLRPAERRNAPVASIGCNRSHNADFQKLMAGWR